MAQGKSRRKGGGGKKSKLRGRATKTRKRNGCKANQKSKAFTFAKIKSFKKKQMSNLKLTRSIHNKNHDLAVETALGNGETLRTIGTTKNRHVRKFKVKQ